MSTKAETRIIDGNEAAADVAYRTNEICIIYPITPSSSMGELADQWSANQRLNIWNSVPAITEMQSEIGVAGAMHGAVQAGALANTFTASQGLLLMIPNMYHLAAELTPTVFHVASRTVAYQGMSIYCDHSDVMATRMTGFAMLCSSNVQEAHDFALIAQVASLKSQIPFLHFFDGLITSHQISKINYLTDNHLKKLIPAQAVAMQRHRRLHSENPTTRGTVYADDIAFQAREAANSYYQQLPEIVEKAMAELTTTTGRSYKLVEFIGDQAAEHIIVIMGSGADTVHETVEYLTAHGKKVGLVKINLFQPFPAKQFIAAIPNTCKAIAVLDRTKECGAGGEPLYQKVTSALIEAKQNNTLNTIPTTIGGRYGVIGKEFTPTMVASIFAELTKTQPKTNFSVGIIDDITASNLQLQEELYIESKDTVQALFYGLGADGTISANKNTIKIIGEETDNYVQGYFFYDAKKSGSKTISHLRFGPKPIRSNYRITQANFIGYHHFKFIQTMDTLQDAAQNAIALLNCPYSAAEVWSQLPRPVQENLSSKKIKLYVIDAYKLAQELGLGSRINTIMQACFFQLTNILPKKIALDKMKEGIRKAYAIKGEAILNKNFAAVEQAASYLERVKIPAQATSQQQMPATVSQKAPPFVQKVLAKMLANHGAELPTSFIPADGTFPAATICWEKRNIATNTPEWNPEQCIQCGRCSLLCPHSCIRVKEVSKEQLTTAPNTLKHAPLKLPKNSGKEYLLQIYHEDCTECGVCVKACPSNALTMAPKQPRLGNERKNIEFFETLPFKDSTSITKATINNLQYLQPMFEFSGACAGCGETPYVKLVSQLFGERMLIGNACGCSSVYGGSLPTSPWSTTPTGCGAAWSSSLFEDNAEFAYGFLLAELKQKQFAAELLEKLTPELPTELSKSLLTAPQTTNQEIAEQRQRIATLKSILTDNKTPEAKQLLDIADFLLKHSIWAIGGDGWAYDIGFGGIDHVIASGKDINILVLDTEVYSNTGGQASKSSSRGQVAKFAFGGKPTAKKELGLMAMTYNDVYVCSIALGANPVQAIKAIVEAESYDGPAIILAYSHCIAHGLNLEEGNPHQKLAVESGYWPLYRYDPRLRQEGKNPFQLDSAEPSIPFTDFAKLENRYRALAETNPAHYQELMELAQQDIATRWQRYKKMAKAF